MAANPSGRSDAGEPLVIPRKVTSRTVDITRSGCISSADKVEGAVADDEAELTDNLCPCAHSATCPRRLGRIADTCGAIADAINRNSSEG